jgi:hypothetical protein
MQPQQFQPSSPGTAVRRTALLPLAYHRAIQYSEAPMIERKVAAYWISAFAEYANLVELAKKIQPAHFSLNERIS